MSDFPEKVIKRLKGEYSDDFIRLLFLLLLKEEKDDFPSYSGPTGGNCRNYMYAHAIQSLLDMVPKEPGSAITTKLYSLWSTQSYGLDSQTFTKKDCTGVVKLQSNAYFWRHLLDVKVSFGLPSRFQHCHIMGTTGSGKTQLIQTMIVSDLDTDASIIVMAPKGNMIPNLLRAVPPEKLILVSPEDIIALNVFNLGIKGDINNTVELINYIFSSILDSETTSKQTALLNYCIRLMLAIPNATIRTLRNLLKYETVPDEYQPYVSTLSLAAQEFFHEQFHQKKTYGETKEQMLWRIDLLLENTLIERMFTQPYTRLNVFDAIESGKVILIDTSIRLLGERGSAFLGRFFISLIALASQQRDTRKKLRPCYVYIDEAAGYIDERIESILERARESRVSLTLAHQQEEQLSTPKLKASVANNTANKFVAHGKALNFRYSCRGHFENFPITVKPGVLESLPHLRTEEEVREANRAKYCVQPVVVTTPAATIIEGDDDIESLNQI